MECDGKSLALTPTSVDVMGMDDGVDLGERAEKRVGGRKLGVLVDGALVRLMLKLGTLS